MLLPIVFDECGFVKTKPVKVGIPSISTSYSIDIPRPRCPSITSQRGIDDKSPSVDLKSPTLTETAHIVSLRATQRAECTTYNYA